MYIHTVFEEEEKEEEEEEENNTPLHLTGLDSTQT